MKALTLFFLGQYVCALCFYPCSLATQESKAVIDPCDYKINGLSFNPQKADIIGVFGQPTKIFQPHYECGFLSAEEQSTVYYTIEYPFFKFTGNRIEGYLLEEVDLAAQSRTRITYKAKALTRNTTIQEFEALFGVSGNKTSYRIFLKASDAALIFNFSAGKLVKIDYWSPC